MPRAYPDKNNDLVETYPIMVLVEKNYLEVLLVRHLQGDNVSTTRATTVATARTSDGADDFVFASPEEALDAGPYPPFEPADTSKCDGHFVWFSISFFAST